MSIEAGTLSETRGLLTPRHRIFGFPTFGIPQIEETDEALPYLNIERVNCTGRERPVKLPDGSTIKHKIASIAARTVLEDMPDFNEIVDFYGLSQGGSIALWAWYMRAKFGGNVGTVVSGYSPGSFPRRTSVLISDLAHEGRKTDKVRKKNLWQSAKYSARYGVDTLREEGLSMRRVRELANGHDARILSSMLWSWYNNEENGRYDNLHAHNIVGDNDRVGRLKGAREMAFSFFDAFSSVVNETETELPGGTRIRTLSGHNIPFTHNEIRGGTHQYDLVGADLSLFVRGLFATGNTPFQRLSRT